MPLALQLIAEQLATSGRPDLGGACMELAKEAGDVKFPFKVPAVQLMCAMADEAHRRKDTELASKLGALIATLKQGEHQVVEASVGYRDISTIGELDAALENARARLIRGAGG